MPIGRLLPHELSDKIEYILDQLCQKTNARLILLADISGQLISQKGVPSSVYPEVFAALSASNVAATAEMAGMLGEPKRFKTLLHEGEKQNVYLANVASSFLLVVVFDVKVTMGIVRLFTAEAIKQLLPIAEQFETFMEHEGASIALGIREDLASGLDDIWNDHEVLGNEAHFE